MNTDITIKAPKGAGRIFLQQPAILLNRPFQGLNQTAEPTVVRITRMFRSLVGYEVRLRAWGDMRKSDGRRHAMVNGKIKCIQISKLVGYSIETTKQARDRNIEEIEHYIDYGLTTEAYEDVTCLDCKLPLDPLAFVQALPEFEPPTTECKACKGIETVRLKKTDPESIYRFKRISHFKRALPDAILVAKVRAGNNDASDAYLELEAKNRNLFKFGNEKQTGLEGPDAEQGVRQGIHDACLRWDPTHPSMATFATYAYNWSRRNSRARKRSQKRAGVYAPSSDGMINDLETGETIVDVLSSKKGVLGSTKVDRVDDDLGPDMRESIAKLPEEQAKIVSDQMDGFTVRQIAGRHNLSIKGVKLLREQAFETLREFMIGYERDYVEVLHD